MKQEICLLRNQVEKAWRQATKELRKGEQQLEKSSSSLRGKVMVGVIDNEESKQVILFVSQQKLYQIKFLVSRYDEIIFNQTEKILEIMNNIEDQNNELLNLRKQLIQENLQIEEKLQMQYQQNFKYIKAWKQNKIQYNSQNKKKQKNMKKEDYQKEQKSLRAKYTTKKQLNINLKSADIVNQVSLNKRH